MDAWQEFLNREQVGSSESGLIAPERLSNKLKNVAQIADSIESERQVNANFQPESASMSERGVGSIPIHIHASNNLSKVSDLRIKFLCL